MFSIVPQMTNPSLDANLYDKMKSFLLFIGYNRSRHTLLAALLDAHPNVIIANDFNILQDWIENPLLSQRSKYYIYELLLAKSRYDVLFGVRSRPVGNNVKDQWQGRYNNSIQVSRDDTEFITWLLSKSKCLASLTRDQGNFKQQNCPTLIYYQRFSGIICKYRAVLSEYCKLPKVTIPQSYVKKLCSLVNLKRRSVVATINPRKHRAHTKPPTPNIGNNVLKHVYFNFPINS